jgi:hypothetical protein
MSDENLDELLSGLNQEYERMPEQVDKRTIMQGIFRKPKKRRFRKMMPLFAILAGLFLFALVSLPYLNDYDQADNNPTYLEMYYLNTLEDFKDSLGLEDVDKFKEVEQAEAVVEYYGSSPNSEDYETAKEEIDYLLSTPQEIVEKAKIQGEFFADDEQFNKKMTQMLYSLQSHLSDLLVEYGIQRKDQEAILDARSNPKNYQGPQEIKSFLNVLKEHGFTIFRQEGDDQLRIGMDFSWQLEQSEEFTGKEGYMHYLELMQDFADRHYEIEWNEMDAILLEAEYIYDAYPDEREAIFENTHLLEVVNNYLREYLALYVEDEIDPEALLQEYNSFLEENKDSRFWEIIKGRVDAIELASTDYLNFRLGSQLHILFNEQFEEITFSDIIDLNYDDRYQAQDIQENYVNYNETAERKILENLDASEMVLLYKYAFERSNAELYSTLFAEDNKWNSYDVEELHETLMEEGWRELFFENARYMVIQEEPGGEHFTATFIIHTEANAQMEWVKEEGVWKLLDQRVEDIPYAEKEF